MIVPSPHERRAQRRRNRQSLLEYWIEQLVSQALKLREAAEHHMSDRDALDSAAQEYRNGTVIMSLRHLFYPAFIGAVYVLDVALFGPVSQYLVGLNFDSLVAGTVAKFVIPLCIIILELRVGQLRYDSEVEGGGEDEEDEGSSEEYKLWTAIAMALAAVVPAGLIALFLAGDSGLPYVSSATIAIAVIVLAFAAHCSVVLGARSLLEAGYDLEWAFRRNRADHRYHTFSSRADAVDVRVMERWREYLRILEAANRQLDWDVFSQRTQRYLKSLIYGEPDRSATHSSSSNGTGDLTEQVKPAEVLKRQARPRRGASEANATNGQRGGR